MEIAKKSASKKGVIWENMAVWRGWVWFAHVCIRHAVCVTVERVASLEEADGRRYAAILPGRAVAKCSLLIAVSRRPLWSL